MKSHIMISRNHKTPCFPIFLHRKKLMESANVLIKPSLVYPISLIKDVAYRWQIAKNMIFKCSEQHQLLKFSMSMHFWPRKKTTSGW